MRRRSKVELGTFSVSALDLFASALGAFILIAVVLLPYFPNLSPDPLKAIIEQLEEDKKGLEESLSEAKDQNALLSSQVADLTAKTAAQTATISQQQGQIDQLTSQVATAQQATSAAQAATAAAMSAADDKDRQISSLKSQLSGSAFIGIEPTVDEITLVVDYSGSTIDYKNDIDSVVQLIVERLEPGKHSLRIVGYTNDSLGALKFSYWPSRTGFDTALDANSKSSALSFVLNRSIASDGGTPTREVMEEVLASDPTSSIFLITDGEPNGVSNAGDMSALSQQLTALNTSGHQINVVAVGNFAESEFASGIAELARKNRGALVAIPTP